jgi:hypothetical protein
MSGAIADLPYFDEAARCPKCWHDDIGTSWEENAHCSGHRYPHDWCPTPTFKPECCTAEHLHRTCRRCHFQWAEAVISCSDQSSDEQPAESGPIGPET